MKKSQEWEAEIGKPIPIPPELAKKAKFKIVYWYANELMVARARKVIIGINDIELVDAFCDTPERVRGITIKQRITYHPRMILVNTQASIIPMNR